MTAVPPLFSHYDSQQETCSPTETESNAQDLEEYQLPTFWNHTFTEYHFDELVAETEGSLIWSGSVRSSGCRVALKLSQHYSTPCSQQIHQQSQNQFVNSNSLLHMAKIHRILIREDYRLMVMQYYPTNIEQLLKQFTTNTNRRYTKYHVDFVIYAFKAILLAVGELHQLGYVHRDLKPDNFLVDQHYEVVVSDLGLVTKQLAVDGSLAGTLQYMAPQRLSKRRSQLPISTSVDVWSLGIILYELFTGETPFNGDSEQELIESICQGFIPSKQIPIQAMELIQGMLQLNAQKRFDLQKILTHSFLQQSQENFEWRKSLQTFA